MVNVAAPHWIIVRQEGADPSERESLQVLSSPSESLRLKMLASYNRARASFLDNGDKNVKLIHGCYEA